MHLKFPAPLGPAWAPEALPSQGTSQGPEVFVVSAGLPSLSVGFVEFSTGFSVCVLVGSFFANAFLCLVGADRKCGQSGLEPVRAVGRCYMQISVSWADEVSAVLMVSFSLRGAPPPDLLE